MVSLMGFSMHMCLCKVGGRGLLLGVERKTTLPFYSA